MRVMRMIMAILTAFIFYGSVARMYRRRRNAGKHRAGARKVRPYDELRLTNL